MKASGNRRQPGGMPMATQSTEGFYRSQLSKSSVSPGDRDHGSASDQNGQAIVDVSNPPLPVQPQTMERDTPAGAGANRPGALRPPNELGRRESEEEASKIPSSGRPRSAGIHPRSAATRIRSAEAIKRSMSQAAAASSAEALALSKIHTQLNEPAMICSLTYRGMEVVFATTHEPEWRVYGICARTRLVFQTLDLPDAGRQEALGLTNKHFAAIRIISVMANQVSGLIAIALSDGTIQTYSPIPTDPVVHAFGRFRWINGPTIRCGHVFYQKGEKTLFNNRRSAKPGETLEMSSSRDQKLLVAHRNQLAVFDVNTITQHPVSDLPGESDAKKQEGVTPAVAQLLWTTSTSEQIVAADISGDGQALAVVADGTRPGVYDTSCGVRIFLRDREDGSQVEEKNAIEPHSKKTSRLERTRSVVILYKQGPFLEHAEPVTRISFRGLGHNSASLLTDDQQENDLLLTYSINDGIARIFSQCNWNQLVDWTTPPNSRVDWVRGTSAFSLGDLETQKRMVPKSDSGPPSRNTSSQALAEEDSSPGLFQSRQLLHNTSPSSAAGAWIAETTFSGSFPALRLSRLSFLKRGSETMHPAIFESVASILPTGSMTSESVLNAGDESLSIHGVWPAWNPWLSETSEVHSEETLSGSAMSFLGLSSGPPAATGGNFGESILGGTHSPPNELRIVASHSLCGNVVVMEFPLWGNRDLGELELGSALRFVLSLPDIADGRADSEEKEQRNISLMTASTAYESNRLVAKLRPDSMSISLTWRKQGTLSIFPSSWESDDYEKNYSRSNYSRCWVEELGIPEQFRDVSLVPVPLALPTLFLPRSVLSVHNECVQSIEWWPDENFGGPPLLVVLTSRGTILVFEVAPPWSALEPPMPTDDPFVDFGGSEQGLDSVGSVQELSLTHTDDDSEDDARSGQKEYDVMITPHPDFGLGLRLESQMDGMPAIAGSYKKHPLTGGKLPAEKVGTIVLGDELLSVNGVRLEGISFDEIITTVRQVGATAGPGKPLCMTFRNASGRQQRGGIDGQKPSAVEGQTTEGSRRTMEDMQGVSTNLSRPNSNNSGNPHSSSKGSFGFGSFNRNNSDASSHATVLVGVDGEHQQEFCRLVATCRKALPCVQDSSEAAPKPCFILSPWTGIGAPVLSHVRGVALMFSAKGNRIYSGQLELSCDCKPDNARVYDLGSFCIEENGNAAVVHSLTAVESGTEGRCIAVFDSEGAMRLVFVSLDIQTEPKFKEGSNTGEHMSFRCTANFRQFRVFRFNDPLPDKCLVRASSVDLLATMHNGTGCLPVVTVWSARPHPVGQLHDTTQKLDEYAASEVPVNTSRDIVDLCFLDTGYLDSNPLLVTLSRTEAVIYKKSSNNNNWNPTRILSYGFLLDSKLEGWGKHSTGNTYPLDCLPHIIPALRSIAESRDEMEYLRSDWHPDSLLASVCTDELGAKHALQHVQRYFVWLSGFVSQDETSSSCASKINKGASDLPSVLLEKPCEIDDEGSSSVLDQTKSEVAIRKLQNVLARGPSREETNNEKASRTSTTTTADPLSIPTVLSSLSSDELRILWAIGEVVLVLPGFEPVDRTGEFFIFASSLFQKIKTLSKEENKEKSRKKTEAIHSFSVKRTSKPVDDLACDTKLSSAACLFAFLSSSQGDLIESFRATCSTINWESVKEYSIPFWLRSDSALAKLSEEVGQNVFREKRDILECALFFIVARKHRTLRNLAATDQTESGRKFFSFITTHDFAGNRGRRAAEKNAYSLLRKRRYSVAAAFFLLAEPPFLKSALEVIATQMKDLNLAFLVARLMESTDLMAPSGALDLLNGGAVAGLGGFLGGGAGYAFSSAPAPQPLGMEKRFDEWKPDLKAVTRNLLLDRGLPSSNEDNCLTAMQLIWLGQPEEASFWLAGLKRATKGSNALPLPDVGDMSLSSVLNRPREKTDGPSSPESHTLDPDVRLIMRTNALLNFLSGPMLLKTMNSNPRSMFASALIVSNSLTRCGIELSSVRALLQSQDPFKKAPGKAKSCHDEKNDEKEARHPSNGMTSSIFDVSVAAPKALSSGTRQSGSSIFDEFDVGPPQKKTASSHGNDISSNAGMNSSIFDSFDAPPKPATSSTGGQIDSSIFDGFDAPPAAANSAGTMNSSIFASFDVPASQAASKEVESSIFAGFGATPQKKQTTKASRGSAMSSIFYSFDAPLTNPATVQDPETRLSPQAHPQCKAPDGSSKPVESEPELPSIAPLDTPLLWLEWRARILSHAAARRLLREVACTITELHGDAFDPPITPFSDEHEALIPARAAEVLQLPCEGDVFLNQIRELLEKICCAFEVDQGVVVLLALRLLAVPYHHIRMFFAVLLYLSTQRGDLAEDLVRDAAHIVMNHCHTLAFSNDEPSKGGKTLAHMSSKYLKRQAARLSWQLELCLWLHRGGALPLSGIAINEAIVAVRVGFAIASWNRNYECLETMIKSDPDCLMDSEAGRQLWTSLKVITVSNEKEKTTGGASSGGWEFLVDCRRSEATDLLRHKPTGCFIIRPHVEDHGVFTLSFKTNLVPTSYEQEDAGGRQPGDQEGAGKPPKPKASRPVKKDDVVQHAIIRLSDSGFRCGSFGPFATLMKLLEAVSASLPFDLRFDQPPAERVIKDEGSQPSPNAVFLRKLGLRHADGVALIPPNENPATAYLRKQADHHKDQSCAERTKEEIASERLRQKMFGMFLELLVLSAIRKPLSSVASCEHEDEPSPVEPGNSSTEHVNDNTQEKNSDIAYSQDGRPSRRFDEGFLAASRILRPFLSWCRMLELACECELAPGLKEVLHTAMSPRITLSASETAIEAIEEEAGRGDSVIRRMIQPNSGVDFRTLRLADGGDSTVVVLFSKKEAVEWLLTFGSEKRKEGALAKLETMEKIRVIEPIDLARLQLKAYSTQKGSKVEEDQGVRYRIVDPWEVEALDSREGETKSAAIGRERFLAFSLGKVATACESVFRSIGGLPALELWTTAKGGVALTKAIASVHPPWERGAGGDQQVKDGVNSEPSPFSNSIRQHLYRNSLFRRIKLPQRFLALVQVELLDLKNLTAPGGSLSLTVYALLRLRRSDSGAALTSKTRTLDTAATHPIKLAKSSGPNAPASWGSVVRFRFPLPEDVSCDGVSLDRNREILFKVCVFWSMCLQRMLIGCWIHERFVCSLL
jgi:hypothetical protein